jgi:hypothetical protein
MMAKSRQCPRLLCPTLPNPPGLQKIVRELDRYPASPSPDFAADPRRLLKTSRRFPVREETRSGSFAAGSPPDGRHAGRKIRAKTLKSLVPRKEKEAGEPSFREFGRRFSAQKARSASKKRPFLPINVAVSPH